MRPSAMPLLTLLNLLLLGMLVWLWYSGSTQWQPPAPVKPDASLFAVPQVDLDAAPVEADLHGRPVFASTRRPPVVDASPESDMNAQSEDVGQPNDEAIERAVLVGLVGDEHSGAALIRIGQEVRRVPVGGRLDGWMLDAISGVGARFSDGSGNRRVLRIERQSAGTQPAGAQGAGADAAALVRSRIAERRRGRESILGNRGDR